MRNTLNEAVELLVSCFQNGGKLLLCGNGGSAADCAHILGELVKGFKLKRPLSEELIDEIGQPWAKDLQMGLPAIDLTCNGAVIGAIVNDIDGQSAYAQQVLAYARPGDVLIGISTSGNAENVLRAMAVAHALGVTNVALTGETGGRMAQACDLLLNVDERETYKVQEKHLALYHQLCIEVEKRMFAQT